MKRASVLILTVLLTAVANDANGQTERSAEKPHVLTADGEVAVGAKVFIGTGGVMSLVGAAGEVRVLGLREEDAEAGQPDSRNGSARIVVTSEEGEGIDVAPPLPVRRGLGGMNVSPPSGSYYAVHPQHGFGFVPRQETVPDTIRLRPAARLEVFVPKRYSPDQFVVLACWMNRYADPIAVQPLRLGAHGMGGMGGGYDPTSMQEPWGSRVSDWRLRTMVAHWSIAEIQPRDDDETANLATVVLPPGEVRITLVPAESVRRSIDNASELEELLLFGGPSQIILTSGTIQYALLNVGAVRDIELIGRVSGSGIPNWTQQENRLLLTTPRRDELSPSAATSDRALIQIAEQQRTMRSQMFLGRIAHRVGRDRYLAIGVPVGQYFAWSVNADNIPMVVSAAKSLEQQQLTQWLEPLSVRAVSPEEVPLREETGKNRTASDPTELDLKLDKTRQQHVYAVSPLANADAGGRMLIDLTKPVRFQPRDPQADPFSTPDPNRNVGVISELELRQSESQGSIQPTGEEETIGVVEATVKWEQPAASPQSGPDRLTEIQRRIEKLEKDLIRAKRMLAVLRKNGIDNTLPSDTRR